MTVIEQLEEVAAENAKLQERIKLLEQQNAEMAAAAEAQHDEAEKLGKLAEEAALAGKAVAEENEALKAQLAEIREAKEALEAEARSAEARAAEIAGHTRAPIAASVPAGNAPASKQELLERLAAVRSNPRAFAEAASALSAEELALLKGEKA